MRLLPLLGLAAAVAVAAEPPSSSAMNDSRSQTRKTLEQNIKLGVRAPEFPSGLSWLNVSRPLTLKSDLAGRVVILDFWTYCCINCMHILPDLAWLEEKYASEPFAVVGVHSAKFENEKDADNIRQAILRYDIRHPVVNDASFRVWSEYAVSAWPTLVVVGPDGKLLAVLSGEGHRETLDEIVSEALALYRAAGPLSNKPLPLSLEREKLVPTELAFPGKLTIDPTRGHLFISDSNHHRVVETTLDGKFVRSIGSGEQGISDGTFAAAKFFRPQGLALVGDALFVADTENHAIRKIDLKSERVTTWAGTGVQGPDRRGGAGPTTALSSPWDLAVRGKTLFIAMAGSHQIWSGDLDSGTVTPFAGTSAEAKQDGDRRSASFAQPSGLALWQEQLFIADSESSSVRRIELASGAVSTVTGAGEEAGNLFVFGDKDGGPGVARLQHPLGVLATQDLIYVADTYNHKIKTVDPKSGVATTLAGTGKAGTSDGTFAAAQFSEPSGLALNGTKLYVTDTNNHRIRVLDLAAKTVSTLMLRDLPLPSPKGMKALSRDVPLLPNARVLTLPKAAVAAGPVSIAVKLALPAGEHLSEGAPSAWQLIAKKRGSSATVGGGALTMLPLESELDLSGVTELEWRALIYHCKEQRYCRVSSISLSVPLETSHDGDRHLDLISSLE